jgi:hypothetical protein
MKLAFFWVPLSAHFISTTTKKGGNLPISSWHNQFKQNFVYAHCVPYEVFLMNLSGKSPSEKCIVLCNCYGFWHKRGNLKKKKKKKFPIFNAFFFYKFFFTFFLVYYGFFIFQFMKLAFFWDHFLSTLFQQPQKRGEICP